MERSTRYSTFSGLSGVCAGLVSLTGCLIQFRCIRRLPADNQATAFLLNWGLVVVLAVAIDFLLTKRRAPLVGKRVLSRLGKQMVLASAPGIGIGGLLTLFFVQQGLADEIYPIWMLAYGAAVSAVGLFSQKAVSRLGWAFLAAGAITLLVRMIFPVPAGDWGLAMMAVSAGGFHMVYGVAMSRQDGW